jgi:hypothetical protein
MRLIALCGLALAFIYGAAFAQQPAPTATQTPVAERIERLERRLSELESRFEANVAPLSPLSLTNTNTVPPANIAVSAPQSTQTNSPLPDIQSPRRACGLVFLLSRGRRRWR